MQIYLPPKLVKGKSRRYITYYQTNPPTGKRERFHQTFDLNRWPKNPSWAKLKLWEVKAHLVNRPYQ